MFQKKKWETEEEARKVRWNRHDTKKDQASSEHCTDFNAFQSFLAIIDVFCDYFSNPHILHAEQLSMKLLFEVSVIVRPRPTFGRS